MISHLKTYQAQILAEFLSKLREQNQSKRIDTQSISKQYPSIGEPDPLIQSAVDKQEAERTKK